MALCPRGLSHRSTEAASVTEPEKRTGRGLLLSLVGVPVGILLTVVVWRLGFIAGICSFIMAKASLAAYRTGAGTDPREGIPGIIAVMVVGVPGSILAVIASDLSDYWAENTAEIEFTRTEFVLQNLINPKLWGEFTKTALMMALFAALGTYGTLRRAAAAKN